MNLFQLKTGPLGNVRMMEFLEDNFVCIGYPGLGDLENIGRNELEERLAGVYEYEGQELAEHLQTINTFVHSMQDGDYVLVADDEWVHLGDLGDYFYAEPFDTAEDGRCHRRGVTWLTSIPYAALNPRVQELLAEQGTVTQFKEPIAAARLDLWIRDPAAVADTNRRGVQVDDETLAEALDILKKALKSGDAERRERAAIAILQYAK